MKAKVLLPFAMLLTFTPPLMAQESDTEEIKDMSDPLAVYTRAGLGVTNKGFNIKIGVESKSGDADTNLMHIIEIRGFGGETVGRDGPYVRNDSVDSLRYRRFAVKKSNGRGSQTEISYNQNSDSGALSYSLLQGLPKWKNFNIYPLVGLDIGIAKDALEDDGTIDSGFSFPGAFGVVGMFGKYRVNEKIWINYNPFWSVGLVGSDNYKDHGFEGHSSVLTHEAAISYTLTARSNIRYYANWSEYTDFSDGTHRIEYNYQF